MLIKKLLVKYTYLIKFILSLCIAFYIPGLIFGYTLFRRSYNEMLTMNEDYYQKTTSSFVVYFDEQLEILREHAYTIALENAKNKNMITKDTITSYPYYYLEVRSYLFDYKKGLPNIPELGLYFINTDYVITSKYKYTVNDFIKLYSGDTCTELMQQMENFFLKNHSKTTILSTFNYVDYKDAKLFVGIPVTMQNHEKALIFYVLNYDSISTSLFSTQSSEHLRLCIFEDDGSLVFANKTSDLDLLDDKNFYDFIISHDNKIFKYSNNNTTTYTAFKAYNTLIDKIFVSIVPQDQIEESFRQFYYKMRTNTILITIGFVLMLIVAIYVNYKPILKLVRSIINKQGNKFIDSELKTISYAFNQMEERISEQKTILMDHLLNNLLHGISIPENDVKHLDMNFHDEKFCVLTIPDLKFTTSERDHFIEYIFQKCNIPVYIVDILHKNYMVLICALNDDDESKIVVKIKEYLFSKYQTSYKIGVGHIVHKLDGIHKSYMNALCSMESTKIDLDTNLDIYNSEISIIENYPSKDITLFLQYVKNGQADNALKILNSIMLYITNEIDTIFSQRYMCYDILVAYFKTLKQIKYPISNKETRDLLSYNNVNELQASLSASIKLVCESIINNNNSIYNSLQKEIIEYINTNFTDPNICRTQVADKFGISICTLSRIFKESIGIGFSEYVAIKRIELSKQLLLTTDKNIFEISSEIGFNDPNYFSRLFKANYGKSPTKFRNR